MLPLSVNAGSLFGLAGSTYLAFRISRQGAMRVDRLWVIPLVTIWAASSAHRPFDLSPFGCAAMALGLAAGISGGWREARASLVSVDLPSRRLIIRTGRSAILSVVALGALTLLLSNIFYAQMLKLVNGGLLMGIGGVCAHRLHLLLAYLRARHQSPDTAPEPRTGETREATAE